MPKELKEPAEDADDLFEAAMVGVKRLQQEEHSKVAQKKTAQQITPQLSDPILDPLKKKSDPPKKRVAILMDAQNIDGMRRRLLDNNELIGRRIEFVKLIAALAQDDEIVANIWFTSDMSNRDERDKFLGYMIKVVEAEVRALQKTSDKDPVDKAIIDYLDVNRDIADRFVLISGDFDYHEALTTLVKAGKQVTIVSIAQTLSSGYQDDPDIEVIDLRSILRQIGNLQDPSESDNQSEEQYSVQLDALVNHEGMTHFLSFIPSITSAGTVKRFTSQLIN